MRDTTLTVGLTVLHGTSPTLGGSAHFHMFTLHMLMQGSGKTAAAWRCDWRSANGSAQCTTAWRRATVDIASCRAECRDPWM